MTDAPLIATDAAAQPAAQRKRWFAVAVIVLVLVLVAAGAGWWWFNARQSIPDWERLPEIVLTAPAGDALAEETPWVRLRLAPLRASAENALRVSLEAPRGNPVSATADGPRIVAMTAQPLDGAATPSEPLALAADPETDGAYGATSPLNQQGWWRFSVEVEGTAAPAEYFLLVPDPNINGPNAVPNFPSSAEAEVVFRRGLAAMTALQSVRYTQWIGDGRNAIVSEHRVVGGGDGTPPALSLRVIGGMDMIIVGSTRWVRPPGDIGWQRQEGAAFLPPSEWGEEYTEATGFTLLGEETIDGEPTQIVAFVAPELTEPSRRTVAWYLWWVGTETGQVRKEAMVYRRHFMLKEYMDFNEPLQILPPDEEGTPAAAATPAA